MDAATADANTATYPLGEVLAEGKTKKIHQVKGKPELVLVISKDDITAGDGAKHDVIPDKARLATETTCNVFELLSACGLQTAFVGRDNANSFVARRCKMLPYEVVVRREAHGSYLKRRPELRKGHHFPKLLVEFYLKTSGRKWKKHDLVCDDPLMRYIEGACIFLYNPAEPIADQEPFLELSESEVFGYEEEWKLFKLMKSAAIDTFLVLERAWQIEGSALVDFKVEFGLDETTGQLLLADVIDNDSWRVLHKGSYIDKQVYRDGGKLDEVAAKYAYVAATTARFGLPLQRIILWTGSESDKTSAFYEAAGDFAPLIHPVVCSAHKQPMRAAETLQALAHQTPDSVVIAHIGMSNGAGPTLAAGSTLPVITVPASVEAHPEDVWSSLRMPSKVPVMTVLSPGNAVLAALNILSARNPRIYMWLRSEVEGRLENSVRL